MIPQMSLCGTHIDCFGQLDSIIFLFSWHAGNAAYPTPVKIMLFCFGLMFGTVIRLPLMCRRLLSKSSFILSGTIIFIAFGILGTFYHMQSLNLSLANEYPWLPLVCILVIAAYYAGGIEQNMKMYEYALTTRRNRFAIHTLSFIISWLTTAGICYKFNHAIWYIGVGWIYYNLVLVTFFVMAFVLLILPKIEATTATKPQSDEIEGSEGGCSSGACTDVTVDVV